MLPGRLVAATLVVPPAPIDVVGPEAYFVGMDAGTADLFRLASVGTARVEVALVQASARSAYRCSSGTALMTPTPRPRTPSGSARSYRM